MPDYMLCFAIALLTHHPLYESNKDVQVLEQLKSALWFILEPLMVKNENFSLQFYKMLLEEMKCHVDASEPPSDILNHVRLSIDAYIMHSRLKKIKFLSIIWKSGVSNKMFYNTWFIENVGALWSFSHHYYEQSHLLQRL